MSIPNSMPPPAREWLADWLHALAARLTSAREHLRERVVSVIGDTVAEAVETIIRVLVRSRPSPPPPYGLPQPPRYEAYDDDQNDWDREPLSSDFRPASPPEPAPEPPRPLWRPFAFAGLHAAAWWLRRHAAGPLLTALAAAAGAALLLLD